MARKLTDEESKQLLQFIPAKVKELGGAMILALLDTGAGSMKVTEELDNPSITADKYEIKVVCKKL